MKEDGDDGDPRPIGVLICDDNAPMRSVLRDVIALRPSLCVVGEAADGDEVIREAELLQPDIILLDLAMPNRTGLEALPKLNEVAPSAKVIVLSSFSSAGVAASAIALGAALCLVKGVSPDAINDAIEAVQAERLLRSVPISAGRAPVV